MKAKRGLSDFSKLRRWFGGHYCGRTDCRNTSSFAVALYCAIGFSSLNALVNAFERLHMVRAWNSSCTGCNAECVVTRSRAAHQTPIPDSSLKDLLIFETTLHRIIVTPEWCFQRE